MPIMQSKRLTVLIISTSYPLWPGSVSGIFVKHLATALDAIVDVSVITPAERGIQHNPTLRPRVHAFRYAPDALQVLAHAPGGIPAAVAGHPWQLSLLPGLMLSMLLTCIWHGRKTEIIFANWSIPGVMAALAGKLLRKPTVVTLRGEDANRATKRGLHRYLLSACMQMCDAVVVVSQALQRRLTDEYPQHAEKLHMIPNGVGEAFLALPLPKMQTDSLRLIFVGSLIPRKSVSTLIRALALLPLHHTLTIVGEGPEEDALRDLCDSLGLADRVTFLGQKHPEELPGLLAESDVLVLPSLSEGRPNVILEALAAGRAVVASDIDGNRELIGQDERGLLFPPGDVHALTDRLQRLDSSTLRVELGLAGRSYIENCELSWGHAARRYEALFRSLKAG